MTTEPKFVSVSRSQVSMSKDLKGKLQGIYQGQILKALVDKATGEEKTVPSYNFDLADGTKISVLADAGLKNEVEGSGIKAGELVRITSLGKKDLGGGKSVNRYNVEVAR